MTLELFIIMLIAMLMGAFLGTTIACRFAPKNKPVGTLRIDQSDPDSEPLLFLEIDAGQTDRLYKQGTVLLRVSLESYIRK